MVKAAAAAAADKRGLRWPLRGAFGHGFDAVKTTGVWDLKMAAGLRGGAAGGGRKKRQSSDIIVITCCVERREVGVIILLVLPSVRRWDLTTGEEHERPSREVSASPF